MVIVLIMLFTTGIVQAVDVLPVKEIESGMTGIGKTVFKGTKVETFSVEIIDILENQSLDRDLILIKIGGKQIDKIGGIAAGMSGSPVYINDKLIGAIGYGWQFSDHHYCLVTPIADMMKLFDQGSIKSGLESESGAESQNSEAVSSYKLSPLKTPLMVNGINGRALKNLKNDFSSYNLEVVPSGYKKINEIGNNSEEGAESLQPGSAIAVELVRGDINIASLGTLTYIDENKILAFGHPFTNKGEVDFLLSKAYINGIIPSAQQPFKLGSSYGPLLGMIHTDRSTGLAGELKKYPEIVPMQIIVEDQSRGIEKKVRVQIIKNELFLTPLASNVALQTIDSTLNRIGRGTAWVKMEVMGNGLPDIEVEAEEMYYSQNDIASRSLADFYQLLNLINSNPFKKINLINMKLEIEVSKDDNVALLQEAKVLNENVYPGDTLNLEITFHPYRQETFTREISVDLPDDIKPGLASIAINGGSLGTTPQAPTHEETETEKELYETKQTQIKGYKNFKSMINEFLEKPSNNDLVVQVYPGYQMPSVPENNLPSEENDEPGIAEDIKNEKAKEREAGNEEQKQDKVSEPEQEPEIKTIEETDYVLEGSLNLDVKIEVATDQKKESKIKKETPVKANDESETKNNKNKAEVKRDLSDSK